jgi:hypothetical protein
MAKQVWETLKIFNGFVCLARYVGYLKLLVYTCSKYYAALWVKTDYIIYSFTNILVDWTSLETKEKMDPNIQDCEEKDSVT